MPPLTSFDQRVGHTRRIVLAVLGAAALAAAVLPPTLTGVHSGHAAGLVAPPVVAPATGVLFGAQVNALDGKDQLPSIDAFQAEIGRRLDVANRYHPFTNTNRTYKPEAAMLAHGRAPMISWRGTDSGTDPHRAAAIASGRYDAVIGQNADEIRALPGGVLVRFNWEMDQGPGQREYIGTPSEFVAAWRHIVTIFRARGATNASFVWAPRAAAFREGSAAAFYPGADYVDWIGASSVPTQTWPSFESTFGAFYAWAAPTGKPLLVWAGVREKPADSQYKADWMTSVATMLPTAMPRVKAFVYYHALSPSGNQFWADTSPQSLGAYKTMGCLPYFDHAGVCGGTPPNPSPSPSPPVPVCAVSVHGTDLGALRAAIAATTPACPGVQLAPVSYALAGTLYLTKPGVVLRGVPGSVITVTERRAHIAVLISAPNVTVTGVTVDRSPGIGIQVSGDSTNIVLSHVTVSNSVLLGFHILRANHVTVSDVFSTHNGSNGIDMHGSRYVTVSGSTFSYNGSPRQPLGTEGNGILAFCAQYITITGNTVLNNSQGQRGGRDGIRISDRASASQNGSIDFPTAHVTVTDNFINDSAHLQGYAIRVGHAPGDLDDITVTGNHGAGSMNPDVYTGGLRPGARATITENLLT